MINVSNASFAARLYRFCDELFCASFGVRYYPSSTTNLCEYGRTVFVWPLVTVASYAWAAFTLYRALWSTPWQQFGFSYIIWWGYVAASISSAFIMAFGVYFLAPWLWRHLVNVFISGAVAMGGAAERVTNSRFSAETGQVANLFVQWLHDRHDRICRPMTFVEDGDRRGHAD